MKKKTNPFKLFQEEEILQPNNNEQISSDEHINNESKEIKKEIQALFTKKEKERKIITTIYITESLAKKLGKISKANDMSVNEVINTVLEKTL